MHNIQIERGIHPHLKFHTMDIFIVTYCVYKTCNDGREFVKERESGTRLNIVRWS